MVALDARGVRDEGLRSSNACCMGAASAAVHLARLLGATRGEVLDYYTSYDVSPNASFVGYAGVVFG
jgi:AmmeMemoRadiSam system protein B